MGKTRSRLTVELITELETIDKKIKTADTDLRDLVTARGSTLLDLHGIGPAGAARLLADVGDVHRFANWDRFASWNSTTPLDASSGEQQRHRLSRAGNRRINRTLHIMGVVQLRNPTAGRTYFDTKKAAGKTSMEAMRALKRHPSNVVYARMLTDQKRRETAGLGRALGDDSAIQRDRPNPGHRPFGQATTQTPPLATPTPLTQRGSHERMCAAIRLVLSMSLCEWTALRLAIEAIHFRPVV